MMWSALALTLLTQVPALRAIWKYIPHPLAASFLIFSVVWLGFMLLLALSERSKVVRNTLRSYKLTAVIMLVMTMLNWFAYPVADARKLQGLGSTSDDAMIQTAQALLQGNPMYSATLYDGTLISPGPGWILLNLPFSATGLWSLMTPFYMALMLWMVARTQGNWLLANQVALTLMSSLNFWELLISGSDIPAIGMALLIIALAAKQRLGTPCRRVLFAWVLGVVSTARIIFLALPPLVALMMMKSRPLAAASIVVVAWVAAGFLHLWASSQVAFYPPLHLFHRADHTIGSSLMVFGGVLTLLVTGFVWVRNDRSSDHYWRGFSLCLLAPFGVVALGEWLSVGMEFARWEGANYLWPTIPICVYTLLRSRHNI